VALVKLDEGPVVTAQLTDLGDTRVEIGMPVEMVTRRIRQDGDERGMIACTPQGCLWLQVQTGIKIIFYKNQNTPHDWGVFLFVTNFSIGILNNYTWIKKESKMSIDNLVIWIIVGGIAGLLADALVKGIRVGLVGAIIVGILGAFIGGWLFGVLGISLGGGIIGEIIVATIGAVVLLVLLKVLRRI